MLSAKECKHYFKNDFILDFLKENDMQSSKFWHEGCSTHYIGLYKTWMLCYWAVLPSLCHLYKTAFSLLMPSKYSAQKTFQFHGLKAVLVRKNFCLKEMYKTISWGVGKPNMNIAIFIGGKKKIVIKVALLTQVLPLFAFSFFHHQVGYIFAKKLSFYWIWQQKRGESYHWRGNSNLLQSFFTRVTFFYFLDKAVCLSQGTLTRAEDESICGA